MRVPVRHIWSYYHPAHGWRATDSVTFPITGGRDGGYRGYSMKRQIYPGEWRVEVVTYNGRISAASTSRSWKAPHRTRHCRAGPYPESRGTGNGERGTGENARQDGPCGPILHVPLGQIPMSSIQSASFRADPRPNKSVAK